MKVKKSFGISMLIFVVLLFTHQIAFAGPDDDPGSVYDYAINWAVQTGATEVTVEAQARYCPYCNPNTYAAPGCTPFHSSGGHNDGTYIAVRIKDSGGTVLGMQKLVLHPGNFTLNFICKWQFVFTGLSVSAGQQVIVEADTYCSWCYHWYPSPVTLTLQGSNSQVTYTGDTLALVGTTANVSGVLVDAGTGNPLVGKTVTFTLNPSAPIATVSAVTNSAGVAATTMFIPAATAAGVYTMDTRFAGDASYFPCSDQDPFTVIVNRPPVAVAGGPYNGLEGSVVNFDGSASFDPDSDPLQYRWDFDNDGTYDTPWSSSPLEFNTWMDDYTGTVKLQVTDGSLYDDDTASVTVANVPPTVGPINVPVAPVAVGATVNVSADFTDPGTDTHTAMWTWDDGTTSPGGISGNTVTGSYAYLGAGIYTVSVTVTDDDSGSGSSTATQYIVVYDPSAGFVTGGGWINSPAGAYRPDTNLTGKANFGFVSKYKKGATTPEGQTEFQFRAGSLNFHSTAYQWLVVAGAKAIYKGDGTVNGGGDYGFMLMAIDGKLASDGVDKFRIKIVDKSTETVVYDNQFGADEDEDPTTAIAGGSIVIHSPKAAPPRVDMPVPVVERERVERTLVFENYPNPFNPETWIPYKLAQDVEVTITIYDAGGHLIRTMDLGHKAAGIYRSKEKAAYWDGVNDNGEQVTSGIYFYTLQAGEFTSTGKMVMVK